MKIQNVNDAAFKVYGQVRTKDYDAAELIKALKAKDAPADAVVYYPSIKEFEELPVKAAIENGFFGGQPIQIGYCNGTNNKLDAVEYHRNSELGIAASDMILLLGKQQDIEADNTYDTSKIEAFFVPEGTIVEMYATTLHYAPCSVDGKPFRNVVILPKGTNMDIEQAPKGAAEDTLLFAKNKWLIAHKDANIAGAFNGLKGENITI